MRGGQCIVAQQVKLLTGLPTSHIAALVQAQILCFLLVHAMRQQMMAQMLGPLSPMRKLQIKF